MQSVLKTAAVAAAFVFTQQTAQAVDATDTWRGGLLVTNVTAACDLQGYPVKGQTLNAVLRPRMEMADPPSSFLVTFANGALLVTPTTTTMPPPSQ